MTTYPSEPEQQTNYCSNMIRSQSTELPGSSGSGQVTPYSDNLIQNKKLIDFGKKNEKAL